MVAGVGRPARCGRVCGQRAVRSAGGQGGRLPLYVTVVVHACYCCCACMDACLHGPAGIPCHLHACILSTHQYITHHTSSCAYIPLLIIYDGGGEGRQHGQHGLLQGRICHPHACVSHTLIPPHPAHLLTQVWRGASKFSMGFCRGAVTADLAEVALPAGQPGRRGTQVRGAADALGMHGEGRT